MPEPDTSKMDRKSRRRRKKKQQTQDNNTGCEPTQGNTKGRKSKSKRRSRRTDRYFGLFHCTNCNRMWESAHVYTIAGTFKVLWKQRCKGCTDDDAWVFPFAMQLIECKMCMKSPCICKCEDCGKLKHRPPQGKGRNPDPPQGSSSQSQVDYCRCRKKKPDMGDRSDPKKPHRRDLCGRCKAGKVCGINRENAAYGGKTGHAPCKIRNTCIGKNL